MLQTVLTTGPPLGIGEATALPSREQPRNVVAPTRTPGETLSSPSDAVAPAASYGAAGGAHPRPSAQATAAPDGPPDPIPEVHAQRGDAALLFVDVVGYTAFAERHPAPDVIRTLNAYVRAVTAPVLALGGHVVDYYGDGFFAKFRPLDGEPEGAYARRAVDAALGVFGALGPFNDALGELLGERFEVRAGLHAGPVVFGTIGRAGAEKPVVVGDAVNGASRVEAANKALGTRLLVTEQAVAVAAGPADGSASARLPVCAVHTYDVELPGKSERFTLYELAVDGPARSTARRPDEG